MRPIHRAAVAVVLLVGLLVAAHVFRAGGTDPAAAIATGTAVAVLCVLLIGWAGRASRRAWVAELRSALRRAPAPAETTELLGEIRRYYETLSDGAPGGASSQPWTARRLRRTLKERLEGEGVLVVANREPYLHERAPDGQIRVRHPASGLVSALEPVMRACSGTWIGHGSGSADREVVDERDRVSVPPGEDSYLLRRVWLTEAEERGYYYGLSNEGLWPLCHIVHTRPVFRREDWETYKAINDRFAEAACAEADREDPIIFLQDYHFAVAPRRIRERLPRATILSFWHIPWPNAERFGICPWPKEILEGMLGSSILGFHTPAHCHNFLDAVDRFLEARVDRANGSVVYRGITTLVRPYPISVEWPNHWALAAPPVEECRKKVLAELKLPPDALLGVGVDRLDYTKGIEERLAAVELLLERSPELRGRFTFVQLAAPSRSLIGAYRDLDALVARTAERINSRFGQGRWRPVVLLRAHHEPPAIFRYYRAADLCCVSSLHDGMNLVAKEFVAAREDERGVLVLSQFTGAAGELSQALVVNPYDTEQMADAFAAALTMSASDQEARMRAMRQQVAEFNVYRWAGRMIDDAARLREQGRVAQSLEARADRDAPPEPAPA
ncbi:MAG TPA: trehalose-6-phosphate synthase [Planctomycetota bacterium]|nr:trehalose-6-phosphate synthase [Planctomycetota bacterium]